MQLELPAFNQDISSEQLGPTGWYKTDGGTRKKRDVKRAYDELCQGSDALCIKGETGLSNAHIYTLKADGILGENVNARVASVVPAKALAVSKANLKNVIVPTLIACLKAFDSSDVPPVYSHLRKEQLMEMYVHNSSI